jgi:hypothetical protein
VCLNTRPYTAFPGEDTELALLCTGKYAARGQNGRSLAESFEGMEVRTLRAYTRDVLVAFVRKRGGPHDLVPEWLKEHPAAALADGGRSAG